MISREQFVQYMIDVKGLSQTGALIIWEDVSGDALEVLSDQEIDQLCSIAGISSK